MKNYKNILFVAVTIITISNSHITRNDDDLTRFFKNNGSKRLVQNDVVAIPARHTEAVETLAEAKNKIQ